MRNQLIVMLKVPRAGRVKTRLGQDIGMVGAAWWFRHQVRQLLMRMQDPRWDLVLAVSPDRAGSLARCWPEHLERVPQGQGDLGQRMSSVAMSRPTGPVCIIGGDIPGIQKHHIARAFATLGSNDVVFGPAPDGGYWLVGFKRLRKLRPDCFGAVRWSTAHALSDSIAAFSDQRIALIDTLQDVDTLEDLKRL